MQKYKFIPEHPHCALPYSVQSVDFRMTDSNLQTC